MKMEIRRASQRGHADHGWLDSRHTFSFADYFDRRFMGFGDLRVINQDVVQPGRGFGTHPHRDMEIISYVVRGALEHKDTLGTGSVIRPGEVQLMRAGRGIAHSEYNHSREALVEFLQIWVQPRVRGVDPGYQQRAFPVEERGLRLVVSPDGADGSLVVQQDMQLLRLLLSEGEEATHAVARRRVWVQVVRGEVDVEGARLMPGDGLAITEAAAVRFQARGEVEALVFDLN